MNQQPDAKALVEQLLAGATPAESQALLEGLRSGQVSSIFEKLDTAPVPDVNPVPSVSRGFRVRLDLQGAKPPVWRRLDLPGDLTLPQVHDVIQAAMGWTDSHLHRFRAGDDARSAYFVTGFDIEEGEDGLLEDQVRLDQVLAAEGDGLWYEYDFGDGWDHALKVEKVLDDSPTTVRCLEGRMACPPEDCGGIWGYQEMAAWVRSGHDRSLLPGVFGSEADAHAWLPADWNPDYFDVAEANNALTAAVAEPVAVVDELNGLLGQHGGQHVRAVLSRPLSHGPTDVSEEEAVRLTETYRLFLEVIADGVTLTSAGYLPPKVVERFAEAAGISTWWIGKANREDLTRPVAAVRNTARALGLVAVRKGRLAPTSVGVGIRDNPQALLQHIVGRLPLGTKDFDRQAGWVALVVVGSGAPREEWRELISDLLFDLGWRTDRDSYLPPPAHSLTLAVLDNLAGVARTGRRVAGVDLAVAATCRLAIRR